MSEEEKPKPRAWKIYDRHGKYEVVGPDTESYKVSNRGKAFRIAHGRADGTLTVEQANRLVELDRLHSGGSSVPGQKRADHRAEIARRKGTQG